MKKGLFIVINPKATYIFMKLYGEQFDSYDMQFGILEGKYAPFSECIHVDNELVRLIPITECQMNRADEIFILLTELEAKVILGEWYNKYRDKLFFLDVINKERPNYRVLFGKKINIERNFTFQQEVKASQIDGKNYMIHENDIPFIFEPRLSLINKSQNDDYYTYSIARKDYINGVYYDNERIAEEKKYKLFNEDVKVILFSKKVKMNNFTDETILLYKYIYGKKNVFYIENINEIKFEENVDYIISKADIRILSPFIVKYFKSYIDCKEKIGLINPSRRKEDFDYKFLYGKGKVIQDFFYAVKNNEIDWLDYITQKAIIADWEMFNYMDWSRIYIDPIETESLISYIEWLCYKNNV